MKTLKLTATEARKDFFKILNEVMYTDTVVIIGKAGTDREVTLISSENKSDMKARRMAQLEKTRGSLKDIKLESDRFGGPAGKKFLDNLRNGNV